MNKKHQPNYKDIVPESLPAEEDIKNVKRKREKERKQLEKENKEKKIKGKVGRKSTRII